MGERRRLHIWERRGQGWKGTVEKGGRSGFTQIGEGLPVPRDAVAFPALMK